MADAPTGSPTANGGITIPVSGRERSKEDELIDGFVFESCALFPLPTSRNPLQGGDTDGNEARERARAFDSLLSSFCRNSGPLSLRMRTPSLTSFTSP